MCKTCNQQIGRPIKKRKARRRGRMNGLNQKDVTTLVTNDVLPATAGAVAASYVPAILAKAKQAKLAKYGNYISLVAGAVLGTTQKGMLGRFGLGMAIGGTAGIAKDLMDGSDKKTSGLGLLPAGVPSFRIMGPAPVPTTTTTEAVQAVKVQ